jgi:hypothetical protein
MNAKAELTEIQLNSFYYNINNLIRRIENLQSERDLKKENENIVIISA